MCISESDFFCPDAAVFQANRVLDISAPDYLAELRQLEKASKSRIRSFDGLCAVLGCRIEFFARAGCHTASHRADLFAWEDSSDREAETIFQKRLKSTEISDSETAQYRTALLLRLCREYARRGWILELRGSAPAASALLNALKETNECPKTIFVP